MRIDCSTSYSLYIRIHKDLVPGSNIHSDHINKLNGNFFSKIIAVYCDNHKKYINMGCVHRVWGKVVTFRVTAYDAKVMWLLNNDIRF